MILTTVTPISPYTQADTCRDRLDDLSWSGEVSWQRFGYTAGVRTNCRQALVDVREFLPPGASLVPSGSAEVMYSLRVPERSVGGARGFFTVYRDGALLIRTLNREEAFRSLSDQFNEDVALHAKEHVFVHAGVVSFEGRAILIPGPSRRGKTTLVQALLALGAGYLSDEYAVLRTDGWVVPYPTRLGIRKSPVERSEPTSPEALRATVQQEPLPVAAVFNVAYEAQRRWEVERLTPASAVLKLLGNSLCARSRPEAALRAATSVALAAQCWTGVRGEAADAALRITGGILELSDQERNLNHEI